MSGRNRRPPPDRRLGEDRRIPRRDFLQGALVGAASTLCGPLLRAYGSEPQDLAGYYPPTRTGLRGSHPGAFEPAHALRERLNDERPIDTGESYDLIIVGGGISGLSAAHFFLKKHGGDARVLILENHDDFGGHARRNEFHVGGGLQLANGGTLEIDSPRPYSPLADGLLRELGIDVEAVAKRVEHREFYDHQGLHKGIFFDRETFGVDRLVPAYRERLTPQLLARSPLSERARSDLLRIELGHVDYMPGLTSDQKKDRLSRISYNDFLRDVAKVDPQVLKFYLAITHSEWAVGSDAVSALDCWGFGEAGFRGMGLQGGSIPRMGPTSAGYRDTGGSYTLHFPDGNATIARALVRALVPEAVPGSGIDNLVGARVDYSRLDRPGSQTRLRLNSIVVGVDHDGNPAGPDAVTVRYVNGGQVFSARARGCVLACWNMMIPYLMPQLPDAQKAALHSLVKSPLVYTTVALRNWEAMHRLRVKSIYAPGGYHSLTQLNSKVDIGAYRSPTDPREPMLLRMERVPSKPGLPEHEQNRAGRAELLATPFATFEHNIRDQLARMLGPGGFDPAIDIEAITVNRWPHGYAPEYNPLWDGDTAPEQRPHVLGRVPFGRVTIANSDAGGAAYTDAAIEQADRAVNELLARLA